MKRSFGSCEKLRAAMSRAVLLTASIAYKDASLDGVRVDFRAVGKRRAGRSEVDGGCGFAHLM